MERTDVYASLQEKMLDYTDYANVPLQSTPEELVAIPRNGGVVGRQIDKTKDKYTGDAVYVRWSLLQKLREAAKLLQEYSRTYQLEVVHGYRGLEVAPRRVIDVPEAAGHLTGGAVDVQIIEQGRPRDMGTSIGELVPDSFTFSPFITKDAWSNRQLLRRVMLTAGLAPFDGEWWHFSYGDKEWAKYYGEKVAIYDQITFSDDRGAA